MRRIVVSEFVSLDGVVEDPGWTFRFGSEEQERFKLDELAESDGLLLRRVTCEGFAEAWPRMDDEAGFADMMNGYPKHVVSATLQEPLEWNNSTVIKGRRSSWRSFGRSTRRTHPHPLPRPPLSVRGARPPPWRGIPPTATADRTTDRHPPNPDTPNEGDAHEHRGDAQRCVGRRLHRRPQRRCRTPLRLVLQRRHPIDPGRDG